MINGMTFSSHKIVTVIILALLVVQENMKLLKHSLQTKHFQETTDLEDSKKEQRIYKDEWFVSTSSSDQDNELVFAFPPPIHAPEGNDAKNLTGTTAEWWDFWGSASFSNMCSVLF